MKRGKLIILSGPSGVGKSTVRKEVFKNEDLNLRYSISMTTRSVRVGEENGVDYHFVDKNTFLNAIKNNKFLEHAKFVDNYYGTLEADVNELLKDGYNVMLEIEVEGAKQVMKIRKEAIFIYLVPPTFEELRNRILNRKSESEEVINKRLMKAKDEMQFKDIYDYVVINDTIENSVIVISEIIKKECNQIKEDNN